MIQSGASIAGWAYYVAEFWGSDEYNPLIVDGETKGKVVIKSVFGNEAKVDVSFQEIALEEVQKMIPGIDKIDLLSDDDQVADAEQVSEER